MNHRLFSFSVFVLSMAVGITTARGQEAGGVIPQPHLALVNANVIDVRTGDIQSNATVLLKDGKIVSVSSGAAPAGAQVIDLEGRYLLPGMIDAHTHLSSLREARRALESGVTTIRTAGVGGYTDVTMRELVREGYVEGPDVVAAGIFISSNLGDGVLADPLLTKLYGGVNTEEELRHLVRVNLSHGVDVIKTRGTERGGLPQTDPRKQAYTEAQLRVIVEEAAAKGIPVQCHAHGDEGAMAAVKAGVLSIEHGTYLSDATLSLMKDKGVFLVPTYTTVIDLTEAGGDYDHPALRIRGYHMRPRLEDSIRRAHEMGIKIVTSTDTSYGPESLTRVSHEIVNFVKLGMTPLEAIQSATTVAAELLQLKGKTGAVEVGLEADLIAVEGNPLEDIRLIQDVLVVVSNGRVAMNRLPFGMPTQ
jgi:imidazolonepropionase-like amidohydrolase